MITIHNSNATQFDTLGLGALAPSFCVVKEELNGLYELELVHPYDSWGKWQKLEKNRILYASTPNGKQAFRIYKVKPTLEQVTVHARHIFYDLLDNFISSLSVGGTASTVLNHIKSSLAYSTGFTFGTDITRSGSVTLERVNPVTALLRHEEDKDSFLKVFGGELERDNFSIRMLQNMGRDKGVQIRYSKNLIGLEIDEDVSEVATRVYPVGKDGLTLPERYINSSHINDYPHPKIYSYDNSQCETVEDLRSEVRKLYAEGLDLPKLNIKIDFQLLGKTEEYKNFAVLENVMLGDLVTVIHNKLNFRKKAKVIFYEWDCLLEKYNSVELGDFVADLTRSIGKGIALGQRGLLLGAESISLSTKSAMTANEVSAKVEQVQGLIRSNVTSTGNYLYICVDNADYTKARRLFRFGASGLQFSSTGLNGSWTTVIDTNGMVNS